MANGFMSPSSVWIAVTEFNWIERQLLLRPNAAFLQNEREENMRGLPLKVKNVKRDFHS